MPEGKVYVKYSAFPGIVTRVLDKQWFKDRGHDVDADVVWDASNRNVVDATDWPEEIVQELKEDGDFTISDSPSAPKQVTNEKYDPRLAGEDLESPVPSGSEGTGTASDGTAAGAKSTTGDTATSGGSRAGRSRTRA